MEPSSSSHCAQSFASLFKLREGELRSGLLGLVFLAPHLRHRLQLGEEVHTRLAVEVLVATETTATTRERKHRQRHRDRNVHADLKKQID
jgi:hypothetical protein